MIEHSFREFKNKLTLLVEEGFEPELSLYLNGNKYMIIAYTDHCSFQRCGYKNDIGEHRYSSLEELYKTVNINGILLKDIWADITDWECFEIEAFEY